MGSREISYYNDRYMGSLSEEQCIALEQLIEYNKDHRYISDLLHIIYDMSSLDIDRMIEDIETVGGLSGEYKRPRGSLRDYQTLGVAFGYYGGNFILGDSVGIGKTVQIAGLCNLLSMDYMKRGKRFRYLILTEKNLAVQLRHEMIRFTGEYVTLIPNGEAKTLDAFYGKNPHTSEVCYNVVGTHALLTTESFLSWLMMCKRFGGGFPFDLLVVDESSVLGGVSSTKIVKGYNSIKKFFKKIIFLNATPFETNVETFYNQLNLLDGHMLPTKENFRKAYCVLRWNGVYNVSTGRYKNESNFKQLIGYFYFARTRKEYGAVIRNCSGGVLFSPLSDIQKFWLKRTQLNRLVFDCPSYFSSSIDFCIENVPKLGSLDKLLNTACADADSILIFAYYKEAQCHLSEWLTARGYSNKVLNGDTRSSDRSLIIEGFKNQCFRILITNVQKGLNFGDCDHCIFYSIDSNPSRMVQFEGRTTRDFDISGKNVYLLCSDGEERHQLESVIKQRTKATVSMTNMDISVVLNILLEGCGISDDVNKEESCIE